MSQTAYSYDFDDGQVGQIADGNRRIESFVNTDSSDIEFGRGVAFGSDAEFNCKNFYQEIATITFSADFVADDDIDISINGDAITTVSYASSHADTLAAVIAAVDGLDGVTAVTGGGRIVTVTRAVLAADTSADILAVVAITSGGAGTATAATVYTTGASYAGCSVLNQNEDGNISQYYALGLMTQGVIWGELVDAITPAVGGSVYVVSRGTDRGKFTTVDDTTTEAVSQAVFKSAYSTLNGKRAAKIEFNRP
jgi:hypothetical protein